MDAKFFISSWQGIVSVSNSPLANSKIGEENNRREQRHSTEVAEMLQKKEKAIGGDERPRVMVNL